jgi:hypothetical protein
LPASCHDRRYIAWAENELGPADARPLGEDARVLARVASTHEVLARAQALAWVFDRPEAFAERELVTLSNHEVADAGALAIVRSAGPVAEILRAAAELEIEYVARLPGVTFDDALAHELERVALAAPSLPAFTVSIARSLQWRGRVHGSSIIVGMPWAEGPDPEHVAWQAAHEATVSECAGGSYELVESSAIALLRERAVAAGLEEAHRRWIERLDLRGVQPARSRT